jgi:hypothetical protein
MKAEDTNRKLHYKKNVLIDILVISILTTCDILKRNWITTNKGSVTIRVHTILL